MSGTQTSACYEIRVDGLLEAGWSAWFDGLRVTGDDRLGQTVIAGPVADQAALHGLLAKVRDLGLTLIAVSACRRSDLRPAARWRTYNAREPLS